MQLHIIGGFLGSGKTTAIIGAARYLAEKGLQVGVITNDQGRHLVDTEILKAEKLPAMEVSGGCFCCHFDDLIDRLKDLINAHHPDVIFAESVGSCADVVATVVRPLLELEIGAVKPCSYTVFADVRLLDRFLNGKEMPFSDGINYIFGKQIEEAGLLFINKTDLIDKDRVDAIIAAAHRSYPVKDLIAASALSQMDVSLWVDDLQSGKFPPPVRSVEIDYDRYAEGEGRLGWIDREYQITAHQNEMETLVEEILAGWLQVIKENNWVDGHVKAIITSPSGVKKISLAQSGEMIDAHSLDQNILREITPTGQLTILLNMLVEAKPDHIIQKMDATTARILKKWKAGFIVKRAFERVPGYPVPTHRISD